MKFLVECVAIHFAFHPLIFFLCRCVHVNRSLVRKKYIKRVAWLMKFRLHSTHHVYSFETGVTVLCPLANLGYIHKNIVWKWFTFCNPWPHYYVPIFVFHVFVSFLFVQTRPIHLHCYSWFGAVQWQLETALAIHHTSVLLYASSVVGIIANGKRMSPRLPNTAHKSMMLRSEFS